MCETLIAYARSSLKRFDTVEDTTGRVLAGGVANRWNTRLKVRCNDADTYWTELDCPVLYRGIVLVLHVLGMCRVCREVELAAPAWMSGYANECSLKKYSAYCRSPVAGRFVDILVYNAMINILINRSWYIFIHITTRILLIVSSQKRHPVVVRSCAAWSSSGCYDTMRPRP